MAARERRSTLLSHDRALKDPFARAACLGLRSVGCLRRACIGGAAGKQRFPTPCPKRDSKNLSAAYFQCSGTMLEGCQRNVFAVTWYKRSPDRLRDGKYLKLVSRSSRMSRWSQEAQPPWSRATRDSWDCLSAAENRYPERRRSSIANWPPPPMRSYPPARVEERHPRRRSSSIDDMPHSYHPHVRSIVLPPLPTHSRRKSTRKSLYFVRPHDGNPRHRRGTLGRLADALTGEGPDIFITSSTRGRLHRDRPRRWQWSGQGLNGGEILSKIVEPGFAWRELEPVREAPWARREWGESYDFRRRRYGGGGPEVWTDARWSPDARRGSWPEQVRDGESGRWTRLG